MTVLRTNKAAAALLAATSLSLFVVPASAQDEFPTSPPEAGEPKGFELPRIETYSLRNGLDVTLVPYGNVPKVTIRANMLVGNINDGETPWISDFTGDMLEEGAGDLDAAGLAEAAASMGGSIGVGVGLDQSFVIMDVLSENAPDAVALIGDILQRPTFPEDGFAKVMQNNLRNLSVAGSQPGSLANDAFTEMVYPDHPYARAVLPDAETIEGYTLEDVKAFHEANFGAQRTHIYVVGKFDKRAMKRAIRRNFGRWEKGPAPLELAPGEGMTGQTAIIPREGSVQSTLRFGGRVPAADMDPATDIANTLLGGYFSSRITRNIREDKGYTYSPFSTISYEKDAAYYAQYADVTTDVTGASLNEIRKEIEGLRSEAPSEEELRGVQNYMSGIYVIQNASRGGLASQLAFSNLHELGPDYLEGYVDRIRATTAEEVQEAAVTYMDPAELNLVIVGDEAAVRRQLAETEGFSDRLEGEDE
jgi:predicted Zn-dependent peptidase